MEQEDVVVAWDVEKTGRSRQYPVCAVGACCLRWQHSKGSGPTAIEILVLLLCMSHSSTRRRRRGRSVFRWKSLKRKRCSSFGTSRRSDRWRCRQVLIFTSEVLDWIQRNGETEREIAIKINQFHERMQITYGSLQEILIEHSGTTSGAACP